MDFQLVTRKTGTSKQLKSQLISTNSGVIFGGEGPLFFNTLPKNFIFALKMGVLWLLRPKILDGKFILATERKNKIRQK